MTPHHQAEYDPRIPADLIRQIQERMDEHAAPTLPPPSNVVASQIADQFYGVCSLFHADLRRQIMRALEAERKVTEYYINQMGRWVAEANKDNPSLHPNALDKPAGI